MSGWRAASPSGCASDLNFLQSFDRERREDFQVSPLYLTFSRRGDSTQSIQRHSITIRTMDVHLPADLGPGSIAEAEQSYPGSPSSPRTEDLTLEPGEHEGIEVEGSGAYGRDAPRSGRGDEDDKSASPRSWDPRRSDSEEYEGYEEYENDEEAELIRAEKLIHSRAGSGEILADAGGERAVKRTRRGNRGDRGDRNGRDGSGDRRPGNSAYEYFPIRTADGVNTTKIAAKLAWKVRRNEQLTPLSAKGPGAIATAMGIISKAREFLEKDGKDIVLIPSVLHAPGANGRGHGSRRDPLNTIIFTLYSSSHRYSVKRTETDRDGTGGNPTLKVTNRSKVAKVAGAVAGRARTSRIGGSEGEDGIWLEASGDEAAEVMMLSLVKGRAYLREGRGDNSGQHVSYRVLVRLEHVPAERDDCSQRGERGEGGKPKWLWVVKCVLH